MTTDHSNPTQEQDAITFEANIEKTLQEDLMAEKESRAWWADFACWFFGTLCGFAFLCALMFLGNFVDCYPVDSFGLLRDHELNVRNFDDATMTGKTLVVGAFTSKCDECGRVKHVWHALMTNYSDHPDVLVNFVDCNRRGSRILCQQLGLKTHPSILYGSPFDLEEYSVNWSSLHEDNLTSNLTSFVASLKAMCGPLRRDACNETETELLNKFESMTDNGRESEIMKADRIVEKAHHGFLNRSDEIKLQIEDMEWNASQEIRQYKIDSGLLWLEEIHAQQSKIDDGDSKMDSSSEKLEL